MVTYHVTNNIVPTHSDTLHQEIIYMATFPKQAILRDKLATINRLVKSNQSAAGCLFWLQKRRKRAKYTEAQKKAAIGIADFGYRYSRNRLYL
jgi:hypothetical protein